MNMPCLRRTGSWGYQAHVCLGPAAEGPPKNNLLLCQHTATTPEQGRPGCTTPMLPSLSVCLSVCPPLPLPAGGVKYLARLGSSDRFCRAKKKTPSSSIGKRLLKYLQAGRQTRGRESSECGPSQFRVTHKRPLLPDTKPDCSLTAPITATKQRSGVPLLLLLLPSTRPSTARTCRSRLAVAP